MPTKKQHAALRKGRAHPKVQALKQQMMSKKDQSLIGQVPDNEMGETGPDPDDQQSAVIPPRQMNASQWGTPQYPPQ